MSTPRLPVLRRGVSLVEALVALAVMAFGMLALVGVQATMRLNSDVAKQRGEATRIATDEIERLRGFRSMAANVDLPGASYDEIGSAETTQAPIDGVGNTTYTITRTVVVAAGTQQKSIAVQVSWTDRSNQTQSVTLETAISGTDPALSGLLAVRHAGSAITQSTGRHNTIPPEAVDIPGGKSAFKPLNMGTVVWVFNNLTGEVVSRCTGITTDQIDLDSDDLTNCQAVSALLLAGEVNFNLRLYTKNLDADYAVLKPVAGSSKALKISRSTNQIVQQCAVPSATAIASLETSDLTACVAVDPARTVSPFQLSCDPTPCTDDATAGLRALDAEAPRWPKLNLSIVRVGTGDTTIDAAQFNQTAAPECVTDAPTSLAGALGSTSRTVRYYCLIYPGSGGWGGRFDVQPLSFSGTGEVAWQTNNTGLKVCRYTPAATHFTQNRNHPATYCMEQSGTATVAAPCSGLRVKGNLIGQNFLVIGAMVNTVANGAPLHCPTDVAINPGAGDLINSNTLVHQP